MPVRCLDSDEQDSDEQHSVGQSIGLTLAGPVGNPCVQELLEEY